MRQPCIFGAPYAQQCRGTQPKQSPEFRARFSRAGRPVTLDIDACTTVVALAERKLAEGMRTRYPDGLAESLARAKNVAVEVHNAAEPEEYKYLPLGGADPENILRGWLAAAQERTRREAQVKYGKDKADANTAFVMPRECSVQVVDVSDAQHNKMHVPPSPVRG